MDDGRERLDRSYREKTKELNRRLSDHRGGMSPEERAVIEAAKALHEAWMEKWDPSDPRLHPVHVRFKLAVDEMLTVEGDYCKGHASAGVDARVVTIDDAGNAVCPTCCKPKGDAERALQEVE